MNAVSRNLRTLVEQRDLKQSALAKVAGVSEGSVSGWLSGRTYPRTKPLEQIAAFYMLSMDDLVSETAGLYAQAHDLVDAPAGATYVNPANARMVPIRNLGAVHAGNPDEAWEFDGEAMLYDKLAAKHPNCYALQVNGTCMNLNFTDRDTIFVDPDMQPRDGSIAVVSIDGGEVLVRRIRMGNNSIMFIAETTETEAWEDIIIQGGEHDVRLIGTVFWWQSTNEGE